MTDPILPPLPPIEVRKHKPTEVFAYATAYATAAVMAEREANAKICENMSVRCSQCAAHNDHDDCDAPQPNDYAAAIREGVPQQWGDGIASRPEYKAAQQAENERVRAMLDDASNVKE